MSRLGIPRESSPTWVAPIAPTVGHTACGKRLPPWPRWRPPASAWPSRRGGGPASYAPQRACPTPTSQGTQSPSSPCTLGEDRGRSGGRIIRSATPGLMTASESWCTSGNVTTEAEACSRWPSKASSPHLHSGRTSLPWIGGARGSSGAESLGTPRTSWRRPPLTWWNWGWSYEAPPHSSAQAHAWTDWPKSWTPGLRTPRSKPRSLAAGLAPYHSLGERATPASSRP